ncbi:MAG: hypothetical protein HN745_12615 [Deltaproteobacteria bacterium]|nr:hypothetical protein [Deltaproteobacteria bacterium]
MQIKYSCKNINCSYPGQPPYEIQFKPESIMDMKNFATPFCRLCRQEMIPSNPVDNCGSLPLFKPGSLKFEIR